MTIKDAVKKLNKQYEDDITSILSVLDGIRDFKAENELEFSTDILICQSVEIEHDYWEYECIDSYSENDIPDNIAANEHTRIMSVEEYETGKICVYVILNVMTEEEEYWDRYAWEENTYDKYDDN